MSMRYHAIVRWTWLAMAGLCAAAQTADELSLVPFPKEVTRYPGGFALARPLVLCAPEKWIWLIGPQVREEFTRAGLTPPALAPIKGKRFDTYLEVPDARRRTLAADKKHGPDAYTLLGSPDSVAVTANTSTGMMYGVQTLVQLIRANREGAVMPLVRIVDYPGKLAWRAYQDDLTRIPSSTFETLRRGIDLGAYFKLNVFTYYMESQFAFKKHPIIGPVDGSLTPEELKALIAYAAPRQVHILGNQQSFGHMERVLCYDEYKPLAETAWILNPAEPATYDFLNDLYSEIMPLLPFPYFNVCCDETQGLGTGPAKAVVDQKGVGTVYAGHIARVHDLVVKRYRKRMMMWGDIVLQHPETLSMIPKDTLMLTWGYEPADSYEGQILPFVKAGYDFVVCPSVRNYGRILPDFRGATVNIQNFTRDGAKHGAWGVINTAWDDGGRTLNAPNWHGIAWGAECAWNDGETSPEDFNRRIGKVLFGERGDYFARGIVALAPLQDIPMTAGASDDRFWRNILAGEVKFTSIEDVCREARDVLAFVDASRPNFEICRDQAIANRDLLDYFLFGVKRYEVMARSTLTSHSAAGLYAEACASPLSDAEPLLKQCQELMESQRDAYAALQREETELYLRENKPYGAGIRRGWYQSKFIDPYASTAGRLRVLRGAVPGGSPLHDAKSIGLELVSAP